MARLLHRLRLRYFREAGPAVLARAREEGWDYALVLVGPSGTGKSHFAEAIAHAAIDRDLRVSWFTLEALTATIGRSRIDASTGKVVERIVRSELVVDDDIGLLPAATDEAEALYRLVDRPTSAVR